MTMHFESGEEKIEIQNFFQFIKNKNNIEL